MKVKVTGKRALGAGMLAAIVVYCVHYLRNPGIVTDHFERYGLIGVITAAVVLIVIAGVAGLWSLFSDPRSIRQAFSLGLGVPALLFAADIGANPSGGGAAKASVLLPLAASAGEGSFWESVRMIVAPVSVVEERAEEEVVRVYAPKLERAKVALQQITLQLDRGSGRLDGGVRAELDLTIDRAFKDLGSKRPQISR